MHINVIHPQTKKAMTTLYTTSESLKDAVNQYKQWYHAAMPVHGHFVPEIEVHDQLRKTACGVHNAPVGYMTLESFSEWVKQRAEPMGVDLERMKFEIDHTNGDSWDSGYAEIRIVQFETEEELNGRIERFKADFLAAISNFDHNGVKAKRIKSIQAQIDNLHKEMSELTA